MKVRGERECQECGTRWSYYETGTVECPECESLRSVGLDERTTHTDTPVRLDLSTHRSRFGESRELLPEDEDGVDMIKSDLREYTRKRGFIRGGKLLTLDATYLAACELLEAVDLYDRLRDPTDADRDYLLSLLAGAEDGDRPSTGNVPDAFREARGMAAVRAVEEYRSDLLVFIDELDPKSEIADIDDASDTTDPSGADIDTASGVSRTARTRDLLEQLRDRTKRVEALGGDVAPAAADSLVDAANAIGEFIRDGDGDALARAQDTLSEHST
ncbi:DUF7117 family protein [Halorubrum pallidum]|uniref:TFIIB-type zinc ribbon-containing protein n=1 Tax=Halorubrum pallidum TaxID=1526114 RepID=A0ABD5T1P0_9EURY